MKRWLRDVKTGRADLVELAALNRAIGARRAKP
jgi:hypothetical protein